MQDSKDELKNIMIGAIENFNREEEYLIKNDLSERCICARFAIYLTAALKDTEYNQYTVDVEYNRGIDGIDRNIKRLYDDPITVDLIVHKRGCKNTCKNNNLICIEMKKSTNRQGCESDETRLRNMINPKFGFCYKTGFMLLINMNKCALEIKEQYYQWRTFRDD